jgi:hypothetical protein
MMRVAGKIIENGLPQPPPEVKKSKGAKYSEHRCVTIDPNAYRAPFNRVRSPREVRNRRPKNWTARWFVLPKVTVEDLRILAIQLAQAQQHSDWPGERQKYPRRVNYFVTAALNDFFKKLGLEEFCVEEKSPLECASRTSCSAAPSPPAAAVFDFRDHFCQSAPMERTLSASDSGPTPRRAKKQFPISSQPAVIHDQVGGIALDAVADTDFDRLPVRCRQHREEVEKDPILAVLRAAAKLDVRKIWHADATSHQVLIVQTKKNLTDLRFSCHRTLTSLELKRRDRTIGGGPDDHQYTGVDLRRAFSRRVRIKIGMNLFAHGRPW